MAAPEAFTKNLQAGQLVTGGLSCLFLFKENQVSEIVAGDMVTVPDGHGHAPFGKAYEVLSIDDYGYATLMSGAWKMKVPVTKCAKVPRIEPPNVHSGGPYIARSVYEKVVTLNTVMAETLVKVEKERDSLKGDVEVLKAINAELKGNVPALKKPTPPAWLRKGWWYCMNADGRWFTFMYPPSAGSHAWSGGGCSILPAAYRPSIPVNRWREACWQVTE